MAELRDRLSDILKDANRSLALLGEKELASLRTAFAASFSDGGVSRVLESGAKVRAVNVDLSTLVAAAKAESARVLQDVFRAVMREITYRGVNWANEALHIALKEGLPALSPPADAAAAK